MLPMLQRHMRNAGSPRSVRTARLEEVIRQHVNYMPYASTRSITCRMGVSDSVVWDMLWVNRRHPYRWQKTRPGRHWPNSRLARKQLANPVTARYGATANEPTAETPVCRGLRSLAYRVVYGVVWTNRTMVSSNTNTNRTGVLAVVNVGLTLPADSPTSSEPLAARTSQPGTRPGPAASRTANQRVAISSLASHQGDPGSIPGRVTGRCRWSAGFLGDLPVPPPLHSGAAPCSPISPSWEIPGRTAYQRHRPARFPLARVREQPRPGIEPGWPRWEAGSLITEPPRPPTNRSLGMGQFREFNDLQPGPHSPVHTRALAVCSLAAAPESSQKHLANRITSRCGVTANEHAAEAPVYRGLRSLTCRSLNSPIPTDNEPFFRERVAGLRDAVLNPEESLYGSRAETELARAGNHSALAEDCRSSVWLLPKQDPGALVPPLSSPPPGGGGGLEGCETVVFRLAAPFLFVAPSPGLYNFTSRGGRGEHGRRMFGNLRIGCSRPSEVAQWTRIRADPGSIPGPPIQISVLHGLPKSLQANSGTDGSLPKPMADPFPVLLCATYIVSNDLADLNSPREGEVSCRRSSEGIHEGERKREHPESTRRWALGESKPRSLLLEVTIKRVTKKIARVSVKIQLTWLANQNKFTQLLHVSDLRADSQGACEFRKQSNGGGRGFRNDEFCKPRVHSADDLPVVRSRLRVQAETVGLHEEVRRRSIPGETVGEGGGREGEAKENSYCWRSKSFGRDWKGASSCPAPL
ncbi:hypothetical protein PR048_022890 [Dryococelus australis]|uniref:Uncharacterized protein n=1 Tax=Dryococelus australis TaxID=614101 RepID=A0ABQ9GSJ9_9NEOP|nr:hypothetical protein PR048_022890 [Dryococelus australis]